MIACFDMETTARNASAEYRAARRALLRMRLRRSSEQTDASARKVEEVLARFAEDFSRRERPVIEPYWC
jgi:hypothetical protein